jgi:hypothetical protein
VSRGADRKICCAGLTRWFNATVPSRSLHTAAGAGAATRGAARVGDRAPGSTRRRSLAWSWAGYAAAGVAFAFAAVSFYWGAGGMAGVSTLGGRFEQLARARDPMIVTMVWVTGFLKVAGGLLALALVQPWGRRLPLRWLRLTAWSGAVLLTVYGVLQVISVALVAFGAVTPSQPVNSTVMWWRLLLWEPWFLIWGVLLGFTAWRSRKRSA